MPYVNNNMHSHNVPMNKGFAPTGKRVSEGWDVRDNQTPSIRDPLFATEREIKDEQAGTKKEREERLQVKLKLEQVATLTDREARLMLSREALREHIEERISAFLMQIIDAYDQPYHFTIGTTEDQTESTPAAELILPKKAALIPAAQLTVTFASAHHGTIPCIYAYPRDAWEAWKAQNDPKALNKPKPVVFFNKSDTYYHNNACTGLETVINQADIDIDGNKTEKQVEFPGKTRSEVKLREFTIGLLNQASRKEITPIQGFALFMEKLQSRVKDLDEEFPTGNKHQIFAAWKEDLEELQDEYRGDYKLLIARLLRIFLPTADRDAIHIEEAVFPRHFQIIQKKNLYQNQLAKQIEELREKILAGGVTPKTFDKAFKWALVKEALERPEAIRTIFQRYYNCSGKNLQQLENDCCKPALKKVTSPEAQRHISAFFSEFAKYIHNFTIDDSLFKSELLAQIRAIRGWSLRRFAQEFNQKFPNEHRLNHEQYRRIEKGCVKIDTPMAKRFAAVFDVHESLFLPQLV